MNSDPGTSPRQRRRSISWLNLIGPLLLLLLLWKLDIAALAGVLAAADPLLVALSVALIVPMIIIKTIRWQGIMRSQSIYFATLPALLAYFGSLFIGLLTPGRLGEFVKTLHVSRDCAVSSARAFSSVLVDRLFDLYILLFVGGAAIFTLALGEAEIWSLVVSALLLTIPPGLFLNNRVFAYIQRIGSMLGRRGQRFFAPDGWLAEMRAGIRQLSGADLLLATVLTVLSYAIFFIECYLLALALHLSVGFVEVSYAVAIGSLITLLPISISGLGTREAAIIAYLGTVGITSEQALSFSLLVFATFYLGGGLIGAVAWWFKPVPLASLRAAQRGE